MNQIPASILILSSSIMAYAATAQSYAYHPTTGQLMGADKSSAVTFILALVALGLGISGVFSLMGATARDRELTFEGAMRPDLFGMFDPRRMARPGYPAATATTARPAVDTSGLHLSPEAKAKLSMAAHLEGREREQIVEEALLHYLPRYESSSKAA